MKLRGDTFKRAYKHWRDDRLQEVQDLRREVRELKQLVEWLCDKIIPDQNQSHAIIAQSSAVVPKRPTTVIVERKILKDAPTQQILDENNKIAGKRDMAYEKIKFWRDIEFNKIQFSNKYVSKQNPDINLGQAYINLGIIKKVGKVTSTLPSGMKLGGYDFIEQTK